MSTESSSEAVECLSALALDAWIAGDDDATTHAARDAHVAQCASCRERASRARLLAAEFLSSAPSLAALANDVRATQRARSKRTALRSAVSVTAGVLAVAAAVMLTWGPHPEPPDPLTRSKGAPHLGVTVKRGDRVVRARPGDVVHPGDALRFDYTSERDGYLALWGDDERALTLYHPDGGERAARIVAGRRVPLDFAVRLDAALGSERFYAVFCDHAAELAPMRAALGRAAPEAPEGCTLDAIDLRKEAAP